MNIKDLLIAGHKVYRAVNHPLREKILDMLTGKEVNVTKIYVILRIEQSVCSQHLAILRKAGLVKVRRDGKFLYYTRNEEKYGQLLELSKKIIE